MLIRFAEEKDLNTINDIYNYFVAHANSTFDTEPYSIENRRKDFAQYQNNKRHNLLVAVDGAEVVGWACNSRYREHPSFDQTTVLTVYIHHKHHGKGVGAALYTKLFDLLNQPKYFHSLLAGIALPNEASVRLHKSFGMEEVGVFKEYAIKHGQFISSMWLQKTMTKT